MNHIFLVIAFVVFSFSSSAQCSLQVITSNDCIGISNSADLRLKALNVDSPTTIEWDITPTNGVDYGAVVGTGNIQFLATFSIQGDYTVTMNSGSCEEQVYEFTVFPLTALQTNIVSDYYLCNGSSFINFDIVNTEDFNLFQWSNIENIGNNTLEYSTLSSFTT